jgi:peroxidase
VVSCADILAFASRDTVILTKGVGWRVPAGRRDGRVSIAQEALDNLPPATFNSTQLIANFAAKGLSVQQMVDLSGSHTLGVTHCDQLQDRIFTPVDPTMPKDLLKKLQKVCTSINIQTPLVMDQYSPSTFDTKYFQNIKEGRGLLTSDQTLFRNPATRPYVLANLKQSAFNKRFASAMVAMTNIQPKTGKQGEIRKLCQFVN